MADKDSAEEVIPSAKRLINSLRSLGYEFPTAVAELVDNSIEADATKVSIQVEFDGANSWVMIADNGRGMTIDKLKEAMRYGSESKYDEKSLGKFGLGLKTSSFSQSKRWIVATRNQSPENEIIAFKWDLDHVNKTDRWQILPIKEKNLEYKMIEALENTTGTVILWKQLEVVLGYENPSTKHVQKKLVNLCRDLEEHLAMVFHRFLMGEVSDKKFQLFLNNNEIHPWDPFARNEKVTKILDAIRIPVEHDGIHGDIVIEPYILPPSKHFSSDQAHSKAAGPRKWNQQQGFYIYRNDRMIQSGGWCKIRTVDEHTKLARFALNFTSKIDSAFKIDVSKMYVQLPHQIRKEVEEKTQPLVMKAREIYDNAEKESPVVTPLTAFTKETPVPTRNDNPVSTAVHSKDAAYPLPRPEPADPPVQSSGSVRCGFSVRPVVIEEELDKKAEKKWTLDEIFNNLKKGASSAEIEVLEKLFNRLRRQMQKK